MVRRKNASPSEESLLISTLHYRKVVGFMGIFLTPVLYLFAGSVFPKSISDYYHTGSGDIFVGTLCALGVFLLCYKGYDMGDHRGSFLAGLAAVLVGLCPTALEGATGTAAFLGKVHWFSAFAFFLAITYLCWFQFVQTDPKKGFVMTSQKKWRNRVYRFCAVVMLSCLAGLLAYWVWKEKIQAAWPSAKPVLVFETIAIVFFGFAWLVKGEALLWDKGRNWLSGEMTTPRVKQTRK